MYKLRLNFPVRAFVRPGEHTHTHEQVHMQTLCSLLSAELILGEYRMGATARLCTEVKSLKRATPRQRLGITKPCIRNEFGVRRKRLPLRQTNQSQPECFFWYMLSPTQFACNQFTVIWTSIREEIPTLRLDVYVIVNGSVSIRAITLLQKHILGFLCLQVGFICWHMVRC